ncbi:MAG TPA: bifunctional diguanylate cyclase/phosphodiesterase [Jatrophihabitantaceae bacterium]|jgi:diguanylate cyclase (GGDEF)-like protein
MRARGQDSRQIRTARGLGVTGWVLIGLYLPASLLLGPRSGDTAQALLVLGLTLFFAVQLARLLLVAIATPARRAALFVLTASVALWAAGASVVNAGKLEEVAHFPAPGEWLFLASYVGLAGYLIIDERRRMNRPLAAWLDVIVICGGTACVSAGLLLLPVAARFGTNGPPLLLALIYPLIDIVLALLVVAQVVLRLRSDARHAAVTCAGLLLMAYADGQFVTSTASATYNFSAVLDAVWASAFALIVGSACRKAPTALTTLPRRNGPTIMVLAAAAAIVVITVRPSAGPGPYVAAVGVLTLAAAGGQLVRALNEARGAADAVALSRTDDLTLLPNRRAVRSRLDEALASHAPVGLMLLDMDGFKEINDTLGHAAGDTVLQLAAHRMRSALPPEIMIARLGGDEFAVVMPTHDEIRLLETARTVLDTLGEPLTADGIEIVLSASIGIAARVESDNSSSELLRRADIAMYQAKMSRAGAVLYDAHHDDFSRPRLQLAEELRKGIADGQLLLWYQPQVDAATQQICGLEALIRWNHPTQGMLTPAVFLPVARRAGLMLALSDEVVKHAVAAVKRLRANGLHQRVAINCAPPELLSGVFLPRLYDALDAAGVPASALVVEVTEDSFLADPERAREIFHELRDHDLQIAIDDYGTGFSSLSYLRDLPVQELKIDRSFVATMLADPRSRTIVLSTLQMARGLGLRIVAEGVEDSATAGELVAMGVDVLQGYHIAKPMALADLEPWIRDWPTFADDIALPSARESTPSNPARRLTRVQGSHR